MISVDIAHQRLHTQHIAAAPFAEPRDVVGYFGAVQAQDYLGSLWAIGLRMDATTEDVVERAIADRTIIRTWPMRGTLHFVAPADIRWMLALLTPRIIARSAGRYRQLELDDAVFARARDVVIKALEGGKQLSRPALYQVLAAADISPVGQRGIHILGHLAQEGLICFGAREGKQPTFALLDEWVPLAKTLTCDEALAELARRYFTSHGPATLHDFAWWSGLPTTAARAGLEMAKPYLQQEVVDGKSYWLDPSTPTVDAPPTAYLLPAYDEYTVAYKDRTAVLQWVDAKTAYSRDGILNAVIVVDGQVKGTWKRVIKKDGVVITPRPFAALDDADRHAFAAAAERYGRFLGLPVIHP